MTTTAKTRLMPLGDCVVVRLANNEEMTASGLVLPDTAKEKPKEAEVLAVGPGRMTDEGRRVPVDLTPGDRVIVQTYAGNEVKVDGEDLLVIREGGIIAKVVK